MRRRQKRNGFVNDIKNLGIAGIGLTVGTAVVESIPGAASAAVGSGMVSAAGLFPALGSVIVAKQVVRQTNSLYSKKRRRRR